MQLFIYLIVHLIARLLCSFSKSIRVKHQRGYNLCHDFEKPCKLALNSVICCGTMLMRCKYNIAQPSISE